MSNLLSTKLLILFAVSFSLVSISGSMAGYAGIFPHVSLARAGPAPATSWIPAGPAMDTEKASIFTNLDSELLNLITPGGGKPGSIDLTDGSLSLSLINCLQNGVSCPPGVNPSQFSVTSPISEHGYYELQFDLSNNFWGVPFNFGSDAGCTAGSVSYSLTLSDPKTASTAGLTTACPGVSIRQGIAHLIDKNLFAVDESACAGRCIPIDNPVPPSTASANGLSTPNSCGWDTLFPFTLEVGPCVVGPVPVTGQAGGVSYHFAGAIACGVAAGCASTPLHAWEAGLGTPDFCAAADHFIAAGLATDKDANTCALTGIAAGVTAHTVNVFSRATNPRTELGNSLFDEICALFTGVFQNTNSAQCNSGVACPTTVTSGPYITETTSCGTAFPGFVTSKTSIINNDWWIYTGAFIGVFPFDSTLYGTYNSLFASNNGASDVPPCSAASVPTSAASDYVYNCIPLYDQLSNATEFAACGSTVNSPAPGQTTPTFGNCAGGVVTGLCGPATNCDSVSAGYQAENLFGQHVVTIPVFSVKGQLGYLADMANVINSVGTSIPQFYTWLNAHTSTPAASGALMANCPATPAITGPDCFRQGFAVDTTSLNPYDASTFWDFNMIGNIYDSLSRQNPAANNQLVDWMTINVQQLTNSQLGYTPALGTTTSYRFTLRGGLFWHDGPQVTPWDVKFSYLTLKATGAFQSVGLAPVRDVHVLNLKVFDINLNSAGPFTLYGITSPTIFPGRHWSASGLSAWDSAVTTCASSATPDSCFTTADPGAITVTATVAGPKFDPVANGVLIGSGPYMCLNSATGTVGGGCSSTGAENPGVGGFYQLTRFGVGTTPGKPGANNSYFRSSGILALDIWSGDNGGITHDFVNVSALAACFEKPIGTSACLHWQQGIGAPLGAFGNPIPCASAYNCAVGFLTVSFVASGFGPGFPGINPAEPYSWLPGIPYGCCSFSPSLVGGASFPLTLYEGISTGNAGNPFPSGTAQVLEPAAFVGCTASYPTGGYDC